jgi:hypothetical protein
MKIWGLFTFGDSVVSKSTIAGDALDWKSRNFGAIGDKWSLTPEILARSDLTLLRGCSKRGIVQHLSRAINFHADLVSTIS